MGYDLVWTPDTIRTMFRRLQMNGMTKEQAGNFIAKMMGLATSKGGWTPDQLIKVLGVREMDKLETSTRL